MTVDAPPSSGSLPWAEDERVLQCLWRPLLAWRGVFLWWHDALPSFVRLVSTCRDFRALGREVWTEGLHQPYLGFTPVSHRMDVMCMELKMRHFLARVQRHLAVEFGIFEVGLVDEYAAWNLERVVEVAQGRDGFPHTTRTSAVWDRRTRMTAWFPERLDLAVAVHDDETEVNVMHCILRAFCDTIGTDHSGGERPPKVVQLDEDEGSLSPRNLGRLLRQFGHDETTVRECCATRPPDTAPHHPSAPSRGTDTPTTTYVLDGVVPLRVMLFLGPTTSSSAFVDLSTSRSTFEHLRVLMQVEAHTGQWTFALPSVRSGVALLQRRLVLAPAGLSDVRRIHDLDRYVGCGFRFDHDDQFWTNDDTALDALARVL